MKKVDFIIVGQGIAGTLLAHDLIEAKKSVIIIDTKLKSSSSKVASGLINNVGMKRCVPTNNAQLYFSKAVARYKNLGMLSWSNENASHWITFTEAQTIKGTPEIPEPPVIEALDNERYKIKHTGVQVQYFGGTIDPKNPEYFSCELCH